MEGQIYLTNLYDYYKLLFTEKQKYYFEDYYFNNLTLAEIAENNEVSRNAVHKQIKEVEERLIIYEEKLSLYNKKIEIEKLIKNIPNEIKEKIEEII